MKKLVTLLLVVMMVAAMATTAFAAKAGEEVTLYCEFAVKES